MTPNLTKLLEMGHILSNDSIELAWWVSWVEALEREMSEPAPLTLKVSNPNRKWELVSAYQKTVRRSDTNFALLLVSAMVSMSAERQYMWRRITTTAAEDIGAGNTPVMKFVVAASTIWTPSMLDDRSAMALWSNLTWLMCESQKSRLYCQYSIMENCIKDKDLDYKEFEKSEFGTEVRSVLSKAIGLSKDLNDCDKWLTAQNWRAEGMLVGPIWKSLLKPTIITTREVPTESVRLKGLPDYCYDMHTRIGKGALYKLCGVLELRQFFVKNPPRSKPEALGWAMFFEEGGKIKDRLADTQTDCLEDIIVAEKHGIGLGAWHELRGIMRGLLSTGRVNEYRSMLLEEEGY